MIQLEHSVMICQPVEKVFNFVTNIANNAKWQTGIEEIELKNNGSLAPGSGYRCVNTFMGKQIETEGIITDLLPNAKCSFKITSGPVRGESSFLFEPVDGGTRFTTIAELDLGFFKLAGIFVGRKARQQLKSDMNTLKRILENGAEAKPAAMV